MFLQQTDAFSFYKEKLSVSGAGFSSLINACRSNFFSTKLACLWFKVDEATINTVTKSRF